MEVYRGNQRTRCAVEIWLWRWGALMRDVGEAATIVSSLCVKLFKVKPWMVSFGGYVSSPTVAAATVGSLHCLHK